MQKDSIARWGQLVVCYAIGNTIVFGAGFFYLLSDNTYKHVVGTLMGMPAMAAQIQHHASSLPINDILHRLLGMSLLLVGLAQFSTRLRRGHPSLHRTLGRIYLILGVVTVTSGLVFAFTSPLAGIGEKVFVTSVAMGLAFILTRAFWLALKGQYSKHREWMIRGFALFLFVTVQRLLYFPFALLTDWPEPSIFEFTGWLSTAIVLIAAETWINLSRNSAAQAQEVGS